MDKAELREYLLEKRNSLSREEVLSASETIIKEIDALIKKNKSIVLLGFMPLGNEIDLRALYKKILAGYYKENFDIDNIVSSASELKYLNNLKAFLTENIVTPSDSFLRYLTSEIYEGRVTQNILNTFSPIIVKGFNQIITQRVNEKLSAALNTSVETKVTTEVVKTEVEDVESVEYEVMTTPAELEVYTVVKMLAKDVITPDRVYYRDNRSYFNVLIDDNIKKWVLRYRSNSKKSTIEIRDKGIFPVSTPLEVANYSKDIIEVIKSFL